ncbi:MAG TPA: type ISP restriction/modification enzyme [Clostridia bacterium]|nr:type ISP restriction/modification enzyme [Clostridia bacterium]
MPISIKNVKDLESLLVYFSEKLNWDIDPESFTDIDDITYDFDANAIGLKEEEFAKISSLRQLRPLVEGQPWGIFSIEFDSKRFEVTALRKVLSGLIPKRRNSEHAMWDKKNLLFLCFWGEYETRTVGIAYFEDKESGLPQIKINYCSPKIEDPIQLDRFENKLSKLSWPSDINDSTSWQSQWASSFTTAYHQVIHNSTTLTNALAEIAKDIQQLILDILHVETSNGYVHLLYEKFRNTLVHDMTDEQFADMYAQTMVYGLFSARCMNGEDNFNPAEAINDIPNTNPFLKNLLKECFAQTDSKLSFDELQLDDIVEVLKKTDIKSILADFNRQTGGGKEDPVIYFYEGFLNAYESEQKKRRGVYYTPQPVVNFIVRAVDDILKTEFDITDGLASIETKTISIKRPSKKRIDGFIKEIDDIDEVPAIQILDPATGTGTFLRQVIRQIWENFKKGKSASEINKNWNEYVHKHLLPRLNGFELMMAPYAVAHMKLAMVLKETGYDFLGDERVNVFLTNSLEEAGNSSNQIKMWEDPLATESVEANRAKKNKGINVVIGNPPYSGESANKGDWIMSLMEDYKKEPGGKQKLQERNPKWINDDYVKFIRYAQLYIERSGAGIVAFINPHGFLDNPTFRGMRWSILSTFDKVYVLDLHGNSNRKEICPDGSKDENVFDIQQGVSILILIRKATKKVGSLGQVYHSDLYGHRDYKYSVLSQTDFYSVAFKEVQSELPEYFFTYKNLPLKNIYDMGISINNLFLVNGTGVITKRDNLCIHMSPQNALRAAEDILSLSKDAFYKKYALPEDVRDWRYVWAKKDISEFGIDPSNVQVISYRPFDNRFIYYTGQARGFVGWPVYKVMQHMIHGENVGLASARSNKSENCDHFFVSKYIMETKYGERTTQSALFPLYIFEHTLEGLQCRPNFAPETIRKICDFLKMNMAPSRKYKGESCFTPIDLFDYVYAVLHSPCYRETYKEFLKIDFPRVPYPTDQDLFWKMVSFGSELRQLHLLESSILSEINSTPLEGNLTIERITYQDNKVYINDTDYFSDVPQIAWEFFIGGYQPAQKWLKDRKGNILNSSDIKHYNKIIRALIETDRIMKEIDSVFDV